MCSFHIGVIGLLAAGVSFAEHPKISPELEGLDGQRQVDVIVTYKEVPGIAHQSKVLVRGGSIRRSLDLVRGGAYRLSAAKLAELADDPDVEYISPDHDVHGTLQFAEPTVNANVALQHGYDGTAVGVDHPRSPSTVSNSVERAGPIPRRLSHPNPAPSRPSPVLWCRIISAFSRKLWVRFERSGNWRRAAMGAAVNRALSWV